METVLIWLGSGFVFAAGMIAGVALLTPRRNDESLEINRTSVRLIAERNETDKRIADALEQLVEIQQVRAGLK